MRSFLLFLGLVMIVGSGLAFDGSSEPSTEAISDTIEQVQPETTATSPAPWEAPSKTKATTPVTLKDDGSNAALFGWLFVCVAALGMTVFVWRSIKKA
ncbi:MAG: hypothetical protein IT229_01890 [Flavobacteriales bacterium]|nr:hypothetical protein [Flavobacteriales bacterium]